MKCTGPKCDRPADVGELCATHYMQARRERPLTPIREGKPFKLVTFRAPPELIRDSARAAKREGIDVSEWWRLAGAERLERKKR